MAALHITNGDSVRATLERSGVEGEVIAWCDVLHDGPVPAGLSADDLREVRARFIAGLRWAPLDEARRDLARQDAWLAGSADREEVTLWFEHDLFDQLQLLQILDRLGALGLDQERFTLVQADRHLGELPPGDLAALRDDRRPVTPAQLELVRGAWLAFGSPTPRAIEALLASSPEALPFVGPALRRHLEEFPSRTNGLARTEQQALEAVAGGASTAHEAFVASQRREKAIYMGDSSFFWRLDELAAGEEPLIALEPLRLTSAGIAVLAGEGDRVELRGIDPWLGGVHLQGRSVWRWDTARAQLVER